MVDMKIQAQASSSSSLSGLPGQINESRNVRPNDRRREPADETSRRRLRAQTLRQKNRARSMRRGMI